MIATFFIVLMLNQAQEKWIVLKSGTVLKCEQVVVQDEWVIVSLAEGFKPEGWKGPQKFKLSKDKVDWEKTNQKEGCQESSSSHTKKKDLSSLVSQKQKRKPLVLDQNSIKKYQTKRSTGPAHNPNFKKFKGYGSKATKLFQLGQGLWVLDYRYEGESNFIAEIIDRFGNRADGLVNEIGSCQGSIAITIHETQDYLINVTHGNGGWGFNLHPPGKEGETFPGPEIGYGSMSTNTTPSDELSKEKEFKPYLLTSTHLESGPMHRLRLRSVQVIDKSFSRIKIMIKGRNSHRVSGTVKFEFSLKLGTSLLGQESVYADIHPNEDFFSTFWVSVSSIDKKPNSASLQFISISNVSVEWPP